MRGDLGPFFVIRCRHRKRRQLIARSPESVRRQAPAVLKNGRAKAVRFSTLDAMCRTLGCQPGDLLEWVEDERS